MPFIVKNGKIVDHTKVVTDNSAVIATLQAKLERYEKALLSIVLDVRSLKPIKETARNALKEDGE